MHWVDVQMFYGRKIEMCSGDVVVQVQKAFEGESSLWKIVQYSFVWQTC